MFRVLQLDFRRTLDYPELLILAKEVYHKAKKIQSYFHIRRYFPFSSQAIGVILGFNPYITIIPSQN